jgi:hypothetical protein
MSTIAAGTTAGTALVNTGDTTGNLAFQTNGTTTALTLDTSQNATFTGDVSVSGSLSTTGGIPTPLLVKGNSTAGAEIRLPEDTDNGSSYVALKAPDSLASNVTCTLPSTTSTLGYINLPAVGTKTGSYTLAVGDVGKYVQVGSGGSITIPDATFAEGDIVSVFNNTSAGITITCSITTAYIAGTDSDKATMTLATRGVATILFISSTVCVVTGNVS